MTNPKEFEIDEWMLYEAIKVFHYITAQAGEPVAMSSPVTEGALSNPTPTIPHRLDEKPNHRPVIDLAETPAVSNGTTPEKVLQAAHKSAPPSNVCDPVVESLLTDEVETCTNDHQGDTTHTDTGTDTGTDPDEFVGLGEDEGDGELVDLSDSFLEAMAVSVNSILHAPNFVESIFDVVELNDNGNDENNEDDAQSFTSALSLDDGEDLF